MGNFAVSQEENYNWDSIHVDNNKESYEEQTRPSVPCLTTILLCIDDYNTTWAKILKINKLITLVKTEFGLLFNKQSFLTGARWRCFARVMLLFLKDNYYRSINGHRQRNTHTTCSLIFHLFCLTEWRYFALNYYQQQRLAHFHLQISDIDFLCLAWLKVANENIVTVKAGQDTNLLKYVYVWISC